MLDIRLKTLGRSHFWIDINIDMYLSRYRNKRPSVPQYFLRYRMTSRMSDIKFRRHIFNVSAYLCQVLSFYHQSSLFIVEEGRVMFSRVLFFMNICLLTTLTPVQRTKSTNQSPIERYFSIHWKEEYLCYFPDSNGMCWRASWHMHQQPLSGRCIYKHW
jgi:hypothetical protein